MGEIVRETGVGERERDAGEKDRVRERQGRKRESEREERKILLLQTQKNSWNFILSCFTPFCGVKHDSGL